MRRIRLTWSDMPRWLHWLSFRRRKCVMCDKPFWDLFYREHCSAACAHEDADFAAECHGHTVNRKL